MWGAWAAPRTGAPDCCCAWLACTCAGFTAVIAVFYTTECGGSRYLHAWSDAFLSAHGVGAQQQAVLDSWFFAPAAEDRPLLPRDRRELM